MARDDIRVDAGWLDNVKTVRLRRELGADAIIHLLRLWVWTGQQRPTDGDLSGLPDDLIEEAAKIPPGTVANLRRLNWIDGPPEASRIHDWEDHQPWLCGKKRREKNAREANRARWGNPQKRPVEPSDTDRNPNSNPPGSPTRSESGRSPVSVSVSVSDTSPPYPPHRDAGDGGLAAAAPAPAGDTAHAPLPAESVDPQEVAAIRDRLGLDDPPGPSSRRPGLRRISEPLTGHAALEDRREELRRQARAIVEESGGQSVADAPEPPEPPAAQEEPDAEPEPTVGGSVEDRLRAYKARRAMAR